MCICMHTHDACRGKVELFRALQQSQGHAPPPLSLVEQQQQQQQQAIKVKKEEERKRQATGGGGGGGGSASSASAVTVQLRVPKKERWSPDKEVTTANFLDYITTMKW